MFQAVHQVIQLLEPQQYRRLPLVFCFLIVSALIQMVSIGALLPFVQLLSNSALIEENIGYKLVYTALGFSHHDTFLIFVALAVLAFFILGNLFQAVSVWFIAKFTWTFYRHLSSRLICKYLKQPYEYFLTRNTSELGKNILLECFQVANHVLSPLLQLIAALTNIVLIIALLVVISPIVTGIALVFFGIAYLFIYFFIRRSLEKSGTNLLALNNKSFKLVAEAFSTVKEIKVLNREKGFLYQYENYVHEFKKLAVKKQTLLQLPRYSIESMGFSLMIFILLYNFLVTNNLHQVLPVIAVFALAGYRLLPALQQIYLTVGSIHSHIAILDTLYHDAMISSEKKESETRETINFHRSIVMDHVSYRYPGADKPALDEISLTIPKAGFVAFVGGSGEGKTTLVDLLLGLLSPRTGSIFIDDIELSGNNLRAWQGKLGYVPQSVVLIDNSVRANIALGFPEKEINQIAVERAAKIAHIHAFIVKELEQGYDTLLGEHGVRLSGGQRQRIGIARAMYHDPEVLIFDEATNALDIMTETSVHGAIQEVAKTKTVILISHRLSTIRECDMIYVINKGKIEDSGSYSELVNRKGLFAQMHLSQTLSINKYA